MFYLAHESKEFNVFDDSHKFCFVEISYCLYWAKYTLIPKHIYYNQSTYLLYSNIELSRKFNKQAGTELC